MGPWCDRRWQEFCVVSNCCADGALAPCHGRRCNIANCCAGLTGRSTVCNTCAGSICRKGGSLALAGSATGIHTATADLCGQFCNCPSTADVGGIVRLMLLQAKRGDPQRPLRPHCTVCHVCHPLTSRSRHDRWGLPWSFGLPVRR